jgi:mannose-6-phosphate isomerase-like protein (cupin superfamily)
MIKYLQLPFNFDVQKMQDELLQLGNQLWKLHFQVKHYNGEWSAILLRSINGDINNGFISPTEDAVYADTILLNECTYFKDILNHFKCPLLSVRLLKLSAGAQIHEHKDADLNFEEGLVRFHIPVITNADVDFYLDKEKMVIQPGECWYMNFNLPHALHNKSNIDRIHLVIDAEVNEWVKNLFASIQITNRKEIAEVAKHSKEELQEIILHLRKLNTDVAIKMADDMEKQLN